MPLHLFAQCAFSLRLSAHNQGGADQLGDGTRMHADLRCVAAFITCVQSGRDLDGCFQQRNVGSLRCRPWAGQRHAN